MGWVGGEPDELDKMIAAEAEKTKRTSVSTLWAKLVGEYKRGRSCISVFEEVADYIRGLEVDLANARAGKFAPVEVEALKMGPGDVGFLVFNNESVDVAVGMGSIISKTLKEVDPNARIVLFDMVDGSRQLRILPGNAAKLELVAMAYAVELYEAGCALEAFTPDAAAAAKNSAGRLFQTLVGGGLEEAKAYLADQQKPSTEAAEGAMR